MDQFGQDTIAILTSFRDQQGTLVAIGGSAADDFGNVVLRQLAGLGEFVDGSRVAFEDRHEIRVHGSVDFVFPLVVSGLFVGLHFVQNGVGIQLVQDFFGNLLVPIGGLLHLVFHALGGLFGRRDHANVLVFQGTGHHAFLGGRAFKQISDLFLLVEFCGIKIRRVPSVRQQGGFQSEFLLDFVEAVRFFPTFVAEC